MTDHITIVRIATEVKNGVLKIRRTFDFHNVAEAEAFVAFCQERHLPTEITFHTTFTAQRAIRHTLRELELADEGRVA